MITIVQLGERWNVSPTGSLIRHVLKHGLVPQFDGEVSVWDVERLETTPEFDNLKRQSERKDARSRKRNPDLPERPRSNGWTITHDQLARRWGLGPNRHRAMLRWLVRIGLLRTIGEHYRVTDAEAVEQQHGVAAVLNLYRRAIRYRAECNRNGFPADAQDMLDSRLAARILDTVARVRLDKRTFTQTDLLVRWGVRRNSRQRNIVQLLVEQGKLPTGDVFTLEDVRRVELNPNFISDARTRNHKRLLREWERRNRRRILSAVWP